MTVQLLQPKQLQSLTFAHANFVGVKVTGSNDSGYQVSVAESVARILSTRLGERVMRPSFGSHLYLLRDRNFNSEWRVLATRYIYEAIEINEPRVRFKQLYFSIDALGKHDFYLELEARS